MTAATVRDVLSGEAGGAPVDSDNDVHGDAGVVGWYVVGPQVPVCVEHAADVDAVYARWGDEVVNVVPIREGEVAARPYVCAVGDHEIEGVEVTGDG